MAYYEFTCAEQQCDVVGVRAPMAEGPGEPPTCAHGPMQRVWAGARDTIVHLDKVDYIEKAYRGEEKIPSLHLGQVRAMVDAQVKRRRKGMANKPRRSVVH